MHKRVFAVAMAAALFGCAAPYDYTADIAASVPPSRALRTQIREAARDYLYDPYSVRDAEISNVATFRDGTQGVCVKANSRNAMGGYSGRHTLAILISNGQLSNSFPNHPLCARPDVRWHDFPELETLAHI